MLIILLLLKALKNVVLCGTNNLNQNSPEDNTDGIINTETRKKKKNRTRDLDLLNILLNIIFASHELNPYY